MPEPERAPAFFCREWQANLQFEAHLNGMEVNIDFTVGAFGIKGGKSEKEAVTQLSHT